jgi:hypothetical protein
MVNIRLILQGNTIQICIQSFQNKHDLSVYISCTQVPSSRVREKLMANAKDLSFWIAEFLKDRCTHQVLPGVSKDVAGFDMADAPEGASKKDRVLLALEGKSQTQVAEIARRLGEHYANFELEEAGLRIHEEGLAPITEITRRDVAKCFEDDLSGNINVLTLIGPLFPVSTAFDEFLDTNTLAREIERHVIRNPGDWSVEYLLERIGALSCSRNRFTRLLEGALHPLARRGSEQLVLVEKINSILQRDGYYLAVAGEESGYPVYALTSLRRGVAGSPKNLIFASIGPKPEIGFSDAINNDIVILSNADSCLVYDRPLSRDGLLWSELVVWWQEQTTEPLDQAAKSLGRRLLQATASEAEAKLFSSYFHLYKDSFEAKLPALIPQVYLHYDPAVIKQLRRRQGLPRRRMDFLLLLPGDQRIVFEVDGKHHFSHEDKPCLLTYAKMVSADRNLRLAGYEVFRFGANELVGPSATSSIQGFFDRLWKLHGLAGRP